MKEIKRSDRSGAPSKKFGKRYYNESCANYNNK